MKTRRSHSATWMLWGGVGVVGLLSLVGVVGAWTPLVVEDDPLVRMPGTQPAAGVDIAAPTTCVACHATPEPESSVADNWKGSMMAQAARDPIFWAAFTVAGQDSIWATGTPNAMDLCERCHFPEGWLAGRSDPPNASLMTGSDFDGVHCDFCHRLWDPFFESTYDGSRESADFTGYWDEAGPLSAQAADDTRLVDASLSTAIKLYSGDDFFVNNQPRYPTYFENTNGQYFVSPSPEKRASFADATAIGHGTLYSRHHKSKYFCGTCHDVSNTVLANLGLSSLPDQSGGADPISEQYAAARFFHLERTFSEFMLSDYGRSGGAPTNLEFQMQGAPTVTWAASCQDCHMRDTTGSATATGSVLRPDESAEHPQSGLPIHDMSGGNTWITHILASLDADGPVYDPVNCEILEQGPAILTLDLDAGESPKSNGAALKAGSDRAKDQLRLAATLQNVTHDPATGALSFRVKNNTGHKLISGFLEGRRMFVNIKAYAGDTLVHEINPYDDGVGTLKGLPGSSSSPPLGPDESRVDELVYEVHPTSELTGEEKTLHFVLATGLHKDNRIPPKGFDVAQAAERLSEPVWDGVSAPEYFGPEEYAGGYDDQSLNIPAGADRVVLALYYQGTSREYIEFLRDEINGTADSLSSPTPSGEPNAYIIQDDPFFGQLKAWGDAIWDLWYHNHGLDGLGTPVEGIVPLEMAQATWLASETTLTADTAKLSQSRKSEGQRAKLRFGFRLGSDRDLAQGLMVTVGGYTESLAAAEIIDKNGRVWLYKRPKTAPKEGIKKLKIQWDRKGNLERDAVKVALVIDNALIFPGGIPADPLVSLDVSIEHGAESGGATVQLTQKKTGKLKYRAEN